MISVMRRPVCHEVPWRRRGRLWYKGAPILCRRGVISLTIVLVGLTVVLCEAVYSQETRQPRAPVFKPFDEDRVVHRIALDPTGQILASAGFHRVRVIRTAMQDRKSV